MRSGASREMSSGESLTVDRRSLRRWLVPALVCAAAAVLSPRAFALAGLGEHQRTYEYNRFANLVAVSPGDLCEGADKYCLLLMRPDGREFRHLGGSLETVSAPSEAPYVLARRSLDDAWLVFDLGTDTILVESADEEGALAVWEDLGQSDPELLNVRNVASRLDETRDSLMLRWGFQIVLLALGAIVPSLVLLLIFGGLARALKRGYHDTGSQIRLVLARIFMLPATLAGIVLAVSLAVLLTVGVINLL